ncbi:MAG: ABC transporter ATP-binding protein [Deltaproteobacteria bacterium]|nr:ABC transporter ATP-binding protein [Deltaproteobacteria bacterium]HCH64092.1 ABC transporter ATP-binding protein [Deltaproteobacteria bacterium]
MTTPAIVAHDLHFAYPTRTHDTPFALHLPVWEVPRGGRVALYGPSGCGKSTLLNLIAGVLPLARGSLEVAGRQLRNLSDAERRAHRIRSLGFVFQDYPLVDHLSAFENVLFPFRLNPALRLDAPARTRASTLLHDLGLGDKGGRRPSALSQGERQRVAIARALVTRPAIVLADEPTAGLDPARSTAVLTLLEQLCEERGVTLLLVSHDPAVLARFEHTLEVGALSSTDEAGP